MMYAFCLKIYGGLRKHNKLSFYGSSKKNKMVFWLELETMPLHGKRQLLIDLCTDDFL